MKTIDFSNYIERYNADEMSEAEKQWFLKELEGNEELRNEVALRKKTDDILKKQNVMALRTKLAEIERQRSLVKTPSRSLSKSPYMKYAAVLVGFIVIGSLLFLPARHINGDELVNKYYKAYEPPTVQRSARSTTDADFSLAIEYYKTHDYNNAAKLFNKVLETKPNDMQTVLLNGVSNYEEKKYPEAKQSFGKVLDNKNNLYVDQARWYLALCYVKTNETARAKELFRAISKETGYYQNDAKRIMKELK